MKKFYVCMFVVALMATSTTLRAQEAEIAVEAQAVEPVADVQEIVTDAVVEEQAEGTLPVAQTEPVASEVIYDEGFVAGVIATDGQPIQAFDSSGCCNSCCGESSIVQPVVYNQPIISRQPIVPESIAIPAVSATTTAEPIVFTPEPVAIIAPETTSFAAPAPAQTFVSAPVASGGCGVCGVQAAAPVACGNCECQNSRRFFQGGVFARLRNAAISSAINNDN